MMRTSQCSSLPGHSLDTVPPGNAEWLASWERRAPARGCGRASARPSQATPLTPHLSVTTCGWHPESVEFLGTSSTSSMTRPPSSYSLSQAKPRLGSHNPPLSHPKPQPVHCSFPSLQLILQAVTEWTPPMTPAPNQHLGWYQARKLPHYDAPHVLQFITFRLADALPITKLRQIEAELRMLPAAEKEIQRRRKVEYWLDQGLGCCALARPELARVFRQGLDRKSTRLNSSHVRISYAVFCLKKKKKTIVGWF